MHHTEVCQTEARHGQVNKFTAFWQKLPMLTWKLNPGLCWPEDYGKHSAYRSRFLCLASSLLLAKTSIWAQLPICRTPAASPFVHTHSPAAPCKPTGTKADAWLSFQILHIYHSLISHQGKVGKNNNHWNLQDKNVNFVHFTKNEFSLWPAAGINLSKSQRRRRTLTCIMLEVLWVLLYLPNVFCCIW